MIIIGYQGIGKSTLAKQGELKVVDLESGNFFVEGKRQADWYVIYCQIAKHLSDQGYIVFTSSHKEVREELRKYSSDTEIKTCTPDLRLKDLWIDRLRERYFSTKLEKDFRAYKNAELYYEKNIVDILNSGFENIILPDMDYVLRDVIRAARKGS